MSCLLRNSNLPMKDILFMYTNLINNIWKYIGSFFTSLVSSLTIHLPIFLVHARENYICSKIYLPFSFFASRLYLYMVSNLQFLQIQMKRHKITSKRLGIVIQRVFNISIVLLLHQAITMLTMITIQNK